MRIDHLAIWVENLEAMKAFYEGYFGATSHEKYVNPIKRFESYFLQFDEGCRLELMHKPDIRTNRIDYDDQRMGLIHFAISVGSKERVDEITKRLEKDGFEVAGQPRTTGDGYYESVVLDPERNILEITV